MVKKGTIDVKITPREILSDAANTACTCWVEDCEFRGDCKSCIALHRYCDSIPACLSAKKEA